MQGTLWDGRMEIKNQDKEKRWSENFWRCATDCKNPLLFFSFPFPLFAMMLKFDTYGNLFCAFYSMRERGRNWWLVSMATHVTTAHPFFLGAKHLEIGFDFVWWWILNARAEDVLKAYSQWHIWLQCDGVYAFCNLIESIMMIED